MKRMTSVTTLLWPAAVALTLVAVGATMGGGRSCARCGRDKEVKPCLRLVKVCEEVEMPEYAHLKEEVFYRDKGKVCHRGYRCDTFYHIWRECNCTSKEGGSASVAISATQTAEKLDLAPLACSCYTVCGCKMLYGAKPTGCHTGEFVRQPVASYKAFVPVMKWETTYLCQNCDESRGKRK